MCQTVKNLITNNATAIIVVESPHTKELESGLPLSGDSGYITAKAFGYSEGSLGELVRDNILSISIVNSFQQALQISKHLKVLNNSLQKIEYKTPSEYRSALKNELMKYDTEETLKNSYKEQIQKALSNSSETKKIVICGFIAQAFFEYAFDSHDHSYGTALNLKVFNYDTFVMYVDHPSPKNKSKYWTPGTEENKILIDFINKDKHC